MPIEKDTVEINELPEAVSYLPMVELSEADEKVETNLESAKNSGFEKLLKMDFSEEELLAIFGLESPKIREERLTRRRDKRPPVLVIKETSLPVLSKPRDRIAKAVAAKQ
jgi:hypothetical protein